MEEPSTLDTIAREAWPPRSAHEWAEAWGLDDARSLEERLAKHADVVTLRDRSGSTVLYASRATFSELVLRSFARWCELLQPCTLDHWADTLLRGLTGQERPVRTPVYTALAATGLAVRTPPNRSDARRPDVTWTSALARTSSAMRFATTYRLALMLGVIPRIELVRPIGREPRLTLTRHSDAATESRGTWSWALSTLSDREAAVLSRRINGATLRKIANEFGVSSGRTAQVETKGLRRLLHPSRSAAVRWRFLRYVAEAPAPLVLPVKSFHDVVARALDVPAVTDRLHGYLEHMLGVELEILDGLLVVIRRFSRSLVPRLDANKWRPNQTIRIPDHPVRGLLPCEGGEGGDPGPECIELALTIRRGPPPRIAVIGRATTRVDRRVRAAFRGGAGPGLLQLATAEAHTEATDSIVFWRHLAALVLDHVTERAANGVAAALSAEPPVDALTRLVRLAPEMPGVAHLTLELMITNWRAVTTALAAEIDADVGDLARSLSRLGSGRKFAGRLHFWLAEGNPLAPHPFEFKATYATLSGATGREAHVPLAAVVAEHAASADVSVLRAITRPLARLRDLAPALSGWIGSGRLLHESHWSVDDAYDLLGALDAVERAGIRVHVPVWWERRPRARARIRLGDRPATRLGIDELVDFSVELVLDGDVLDPSEVERVLAMARGLVFLRGRWVEVDGARIGRALERWGTVGSSGSVPVREAARLVAGVAGGSPAGASSSEFSWSLPESGPWLAQALAFLARPDSEVAGHEDSESALPLRAYQCVGLGWLARLYVLGLGGCLADDMGLGKTLQVLALIERLRRRGDLTPHLVIAPASLLAHWETQVRQWLPDLPIHVAHALWSGEAPRGESQDIGDAAVVLVSYTSVERCRWLGKTHWGLIVLDEAQAIKTPTTTSAQAVKKLTGRCRIAMTGTPIENHLGDYWSVFDFINPGLLGSPEDFARFLASHRQDEDPYRALRELTAPYVLRRRKSDPSVLGELPAKIHRQVSCFLTPVQAALYQQAVDELAGRLESATPLDFAGLILPYLHRLKQICNHPSHWLRDGVYAVADSGKFANLASLGAQLAEAGEKVLVFTQYREVADPIADVLAMAYGRRGLVMSSVVVLTERKRYVERFQTSADVPFLVMTLRTGGAGLNLTAATHVVHFDRWWNPAVENQATDRAHRIGQTKSVTVHTFTCPGTLEERIDRLLREKHALAEDVLATDGEAILTRMTRDELLAVLALDVNVASGRGPV